jgi:hypothetical protein
VKSQYRYKRKQALIGAARILDARYHEAFAFFRVQNLPSDFMNPSVGL